MSELGKLLRNGSNALQQQEIVRVEKAIAQKEDRLTESQFTATSSAIDAEQGVSIVETSGGSFYAQSITNRALEGGAVSMPLGQTIGKVDERPVVFGSSFSDSGLRLQ